MYRVNNKGPSMDPCGTPHTTGGSFDRAWPTLVACLRLLRYDSNHAVADGRSP